MQTPSSPQLTLGRLQGREIQAAFNGGRLSSDGGVALLAQADKAQGLTAGLSSLIRDRRNPLKITHELIEMLRQRVYQICNGYEDCNDADDLRRDPMFKLAVGRLPETGEDLASQPTLSRLENSVSRRDLWHIAEFFVALFFRQYRQAKPKRIVLDFDATDDPTHGQQQFSGFNGHYDEHCYCPLVVTAQVDGGPHELLVAMLRPGAPTGDGGALAVLRRLVERLRAQWPGVAIVFRADAGFCRPELFEWCEDPENRVDYIVAIAKNRALERHAEPFVQQAKAKFEATGKEARVMGEFMYAAGTWNTERQVVVRAEFAADGSDPRFVVTSFTEPEPTGLYDEYAMRGDMENRIKELKNGLKADRTSCHRFMANQFRLFLHAAAFCLLNHIRRGLRGTRLQDAQVGTIQRHVLKLAVRVTQSTRRVCLHFASACPVQDLWPGLLTRIWEGCTAMT